MTKESAERKMLKEVRALLAPLTFYTVQEILGFGGAGYVLNVRHRVFGDRAMKLVHPSLLQKPGIRERFELEAKVMHRLTHPNLVKVHEMGEAGDFPYIVMDLLEGGTLEDHLKAFGVMPPKQAARVAIAILRGLQVAHDDGVVHRDIKPGNILFSTDGTPKITDFGIARLAEAGRALTQEGWTVGTFSYMPPEQLHGALDIDHRADIHAVGVTLYTMLTMGELGESAFHLQLEEFPERLEGVPDVLQMVIRVATSRVRDNRFPSATAMADELEAYLGADLPDDPPDTPKLGSAMSVPSPNRSMTREQAGYEVVDPDGLSVSHESSVPMLPTGAIGMIPGLETDERAALPMGTIMPTGVYNPAHKAQVAQLRAAAMRRALTRVVLPVALVLLLGAGVWFAMRPEPVEAVKDPSARERGEEPVVEVEPDPTPEPVVEVSPEPTPEPAVRHPPTPVKTPTPAPVATSAPTPQPEVEVVPTGQVQLVLVGDTTASITLTGEGETQTLTRGSRDLPQGTYRVEAQISGRDDPQVGNVTVTSMGVVTIRCNAQYRKCTGF